MRKFPSQNVSEHPATRLEEIAEHFEASTSSAFDVLARERITLKKSPYMIMNKVKLSMRK